MTKSIRAGAALFAIVALTTAPALAQQPAPLQPAPESTAPAVPETSVKDCGKRLESFIRSLAQRFDGTNPSTPTQRRALDTLKSASDKALEAVRSACADEKSAAAVKNLEAATEQAQTSLEKLGPALQDLYASLTEKQKQELNSLKNQLEALSKDWSQFAFNLDRFVQSDTDPRSGETRTCIANFCFSYRNDFSNDRRFPAPRRPLKPGEEEI